MEPRGAPASGGIRHGGCQAGQCGHRAAIQDACGAGHGEQGFLRALGSPEEAVQD